MGEVFLDAFLDTLKVFPFLLAIYVLIELIEHKTSITENRKILQGGLAPLLGGAAGIVPLCGFAVMAAKLYDKNYIKTGTLMSVFIATSDEALIILASDVSVRGAYAVLPLIAVKLVFAVAAGYILNAALRREPVAQTVPKGEAEYSCGHHDKSAATVYFISPLWHSLKIALYLFLVNLAFGTLIYFVGAQTIAGALGVNLWVQPLITSAVGLIPGCASSVILTSAYLHGGIAFGSMAAGLSVNAGMGFVVLFKNLKKTKRNFALLALSFAVACLMGISVNSFAPALGL